MTGEVQKVKRSKPILGMIQTSKSQLPQKFENNDETDEIEQNLFDTIEKTVHEDGATLNHAADKNPIINKRILLKLNYEQSNNLESEFAPVDSEADLNGNQNPDESNHAQMKAKLFKSEPLGAGAAENEKGDPIFDRMPSENVIYDKMKVMKQYPATVAGAETAGDHKPHSNEGRIVVYGDSNCLDSTHIQKPCFWLLDALLEYTMTSHVSTILKDLNRSSSIRFATNSMAMPKRLPNNNLHLYSKVLMPAASTSDGAANSALNEVQSKPNQQIKRPIPMCGRLQWDTPIFLNITAPNDFHLLNGRKDELDNDDANMMGELNLRRKLESQKGEVCSVESNVFCWIWFRLYWKFTFLSTIYYLRSFSDFLIFHSNEFLFISI